MTTLIIFAKVTGRRLMSMKKKKETEKSVETVDLGGNMIYLSLSMLKFREKHKIQEEQSYRQLRDYEEVLTYWEKRE